MSTTPPRAAAPSPAAPAAGTRAPGRTVAIGDIHADLDALLRILAGLALIDEHGRWAGGACRLVLLGDLVDRGPDSLAVVSYLMTLEPQAAAAGGELVVLLGNHELMVAQGTFHFLPAGDAEAAADYRCGERQGLDAVYRGDSAWARWIRQRPALARVGSTLFVHAGLDARMLGLSLDEINRTVQAWVAWHQGAGEPPDASTAWLVGIGSGGPLWTRDYMVSLEPWPHDDRVHAGTRACLEHFGAQRVIVGHSPTAALDCAIAWPHPVFGELVGVIDTAISRHYGGRLSALEIVDDQAPRARYFERGGEDLLLTRALRAIHGQPR